MQDVVGQQVQPVVDAAQMGAQTLLMLGDEVGVVGQGGDQVLAHSVVGCQVQAGAVAELRRVLHKVSPGLGLGRDVEEVFLRHPQVEEVDRMGRGHGVFVHPGEAAAETAGDLVGKHLGAAAAFFQVVVLIVIQPAEALPHQLDLAVAHHQQL